MPLKYFTARRLDPSPQRIALNCRVLSAQSHCVQRNHIAICGVFQPRDIVPHRVRLRPDVVAVLCGVLRQSYQGILN